MSKLSENIKTLTECCGVSGFENKVAGKIKDMFIPFCDNVYQNALGSVIAYKKGKSHSTGSVMIEAHMDEVGFIVTGIDDDGFIKFTNIGGVDYRILPGSEVIIHSKKEHLGIIGAKPPHLIKEDEKDKALKIDSLFIDAGFTKEECEKEIRVGDSITFVPEYTSLLNGYICSKSHDDRTSVAILLDLAEKIYNSPVDFDVYFVCAVCEETNGSGGVTSAYEINPDFAVVLDVTHGDTPDAADSSYKTGGGIVLSKGPNIHPLLLNNFLCVMDNNKIEYHLEIDGGSTGTDAWNIQIAKDGIPCLVLSCPLRYMHTYSEVVKEDDAVQCTDALYTFLKSFDKAGDVLC